MKVLQRAPRKALVLSPVASHPQNFGNRRRVYQTCRFLRQQGYEIHFLLYPMEPDWMDRVQDEAQDMRKEWDSFQVIPSSRPFPLQSPAIAEHHTIDEWWDPTIAAHLSWLFDREHFDVFVVNYVFMSKAFEYAGSRTAKVLEAHDRFAGRLELLRKLNARIESFYTTDAEEKIALDRSDIVIAIKESEAEFYAGLTDREVISVPFWQDQKQRPSPTEGNNDAPLRVGFIGALNVVNVANMEAFLKEFESRPDITVAPLVFDIAGEVCEFLESRHRQVRLLGRVESLDEFYDNLDVVAVPMTLSTGLKIKTGEALAFGKAVVAMDDGFDGFPPVDEFHTLDSFAATCRALIVLASDRARLAELERRSRISALLARRRKDAGYRKLAAAILRVAPRILFVTDLPVFEEGNAQVERLAQWCQLCTGTARTMIAYLGEGLPGATRPELREVEIVALGDGTAAGQDSGISDWDAFARRYNIFEIVLSVDGSAAPELLQIAQAHCARVNLDTWRPALAAIAHDKTALPAPDYWQDWEQGTDVLVSPTALRYRPRYFDSWRAKRADGVLAILCGPDDDDRAGLEILRDGIAGLDPDALTLAAGPDAAFEQDFFARLSAGRRPRLFLAIGRNATAHAFCEAFAIQFRTPCLHLSHAELPCLLPRPDGRSVLCETYPDIARYADDPERLDQIVTIHRTDTGWSVYKERLLARLAVADRNTAGNRAEPRDK